MSREHRINSENQVREACFTSSHPVSKVLEYALKWATSKNSPNLKIVLMMHAVAKALALHVCPCSSQSVVVGEEELVLVLLAQPLSLHLQHCSLCYGWQAFPLLYLKMNTA